ncbi:cytochrome P450 [Nocardia sp. NPDC051052]|uniref:cytochrome P450 n=1 Tax=Nocardia sp. NPDC051052 TaxID=3364322 RepID=UPI0037B2BD0C
MSHPTLTASNLPDLISSGFRRDPYPAFHRLRADAPVHYSAQWRAWLITRYRDVVTGLSDPAVSADRITPRLRQFPAADRPRFGELTKVLSQWPLLLDPPRHATERAPLTAAMHRSVIQKFRPLVHAVVTELLDRALDRQHVDAVADIAVPLPLYVVAELLGVPRDALDPLKRCAIDIVDFLGTPPATYLPKADVATRTLQDTVELLRPIVRARARQPRNDLISALLAASRRTGAVDEDRIIATCIMMVFAGFETTTNLLGNGLLLLMRHPEQFGLLRATPELLDSAIKEMLRVESPVQRLSRMTTADIQLSGQQIPANELVFFMVGAANRDPGVFTDPDRFDITRPGGRHLAFGHWVHTCPGSALAQLEAEILFGELSRRTTDIRLVREEIEWHENLSVRALRSLPVTLRPAQGER